MNRRVRLRYPQEQIQEPLIALLTKDYNVMTNIRRARVTETIGEVVLEIDGDDSNVAMGIDFLKSKGVSVELIEGDVIE